MIDPTSVKIKSENLGIPGTLSLGVKKVFTTVKKKKNHPVEVKFL